MVNLADDLGWWFDAEAGHFTPKIDGRWATPEEIRDLKERMARRGIPDAMKYVLPDGSFDEARLLDDVMAKLQPAG